MHRWLPDFIELKRSPAGRQGFEVMRIQSKLFTGNRRTFRSVSTYVGYDCLLTKTANADTRQGKAEIDATVSHLRHRRRAGNCVGHIARLVRRARL